MEQRKNWHPERIKYELRMKGSSLAVVARELGVTRAAVSMSIKDDARRSRRIEAAVAAALGVRPRTIWPDRYRTVPRGSAAAA